jgi:hypothetical protein
MAWADEIAGHNTLIDDMQRQKDWISGVSRTWFEGVTTGTSLIERTADGAVGYFTAWRTANPDATAESDRAGYELWDYWINGQMGSGSESKTKDEVVVELTNGIASITADRDSLQAKIDNGEVDAG